MRADFLIPWREEREEEVVDIPREDRAATSATLSRRESVIAETAADSPTTEVMEEGVTSVVTLADPLALAMHSREASATAAPAADSPTEARAEEEDSPTSRATPADLLPCATHSRGASATAARAADSRTETYSAEELLTALPALATPSSAASVIAATAAGSLMIPLHPLAVATAAAEVCAMLSSAESATVEMLAGSPTTCHLPPRATHPYIKHAAMSIPPPLIHSHAQRFEILPIFFSHNCLTFGGFGQEGGASSVVFFGD